MKVNACMISLVLIAIVAILLLMNQPNWSRSRSKYSDREMMNGDEMMEGEEAVEMTVRYRTVGDASCTGAVESTAATVEEVIEEVAATRITERGATRADDRATEAAMEDRKKEGYF